MGGAEPLDAAGLIDGAFGYSCRMASMRARN